MAYTNFQNCTKQEYDNIVYSGGANYKLKILFNNVELQEADRYCQKITRESRIIPNDGKDRFSLDNFISQEITLVLHNIDESIIQDQVSISIGTLISGNTYEYVPLGIFNIQGTPTTNNNKVTIKLRDNRVKFDFNYNALPLIDEGGGKTTKRLILNDICEKAGVTNNVSSFLGENDEVGVYDSTIKATTYVSYLAEQAGAIATINRYGELEFIYLNNLITQRIPLSIVEKYERDVGFTIERVVYEDAIRKFETSSDKTLDTLFINSANPYISSQSQIDNIFTLVQNFTTDTLTTGKVLGNLSIDPYDLIQIYDDYNEDEPIIGTTLACCSTTYNGCIINKYTTKIGIKERQENVTVSGEAAFKKYVGTEINNLDASIRLVSGKVSDQSEQIAEIQLEYQELLARISEISDITTSGESTIANVPLTGVNSSQPIKIKIKPIIENISYLYPNTGFIVGTGKILKKRNLVFENTTTHEIFTWTLPTNLWYLNSTVADELDLSYNNGDNRTVIVTRKCNYNKATGEITAKVTPTTETYSYPDDIILTDGDYNVYLDNYYTGYLYVQLMAKNIYTTQFYTQAETNAKISETASEITAGVSQTLTNYYNKDETNAQIDIKANQIQSSVAETYTKIETYNSGISSANSSISNLSDNITEANSNIENLSTNFNNYATNQTVTTVSNRVDTIQTTLNQQINILEDISENGVSKVTTETNYTFDKNGLDIKKSDEPTESVVNNNGVKVSDGEETLLFAGYDTTSNTSKVEAHDMSIRDHEILMGHFRVENYSTGVGWFWLG